MRDAEIIGTVDGFKVERAFYNGRRLDAWPLVAAVPALAALLMGCASLSPSLGGVARQPFGVTKEGTPVELYTLRNAKGVEAKICNYGGIVVSLKVPDRNGQMGDVVLGYDTLAEYIKESPYFGALIGRYGNRIAKGKFTLDGKQYTLATNNGPNALHGGIKGFDKVVWQAKPTQGKLGPALEIGRAHV